MKLPNRVIFKNPDTILPDGQVYSMYVRMSVTDNSYCGINHAIIVLVTLIFAKSFTKLSTILKATI